MIEDKILARNVPTRRAACHFEKRPCFLDHLIPFCHLLDMPLIASNQESLILAEQFYPKVDLIYTEEPTSTLDAFDQIFYGQPYKCFPYGINFPHFFYPKKIKTCCTLHGNSEKYLEDFWLERFIDEDIVMIYGDLLKDLFIEKGVYHRIKHPVICGNMRAHFYQEHKDFFCKKVAPLLPPKEGKKRILWAPTWDSKKNECFFQIAWYILPLLPSDFQMIIKPHPLMSIECPKEMAALQESFPEVTILEQMPLIYPILDQVDLFLGESSSVAYDFLTLNRPLYFLTETLAIHAMGRVIQPSELARIFHIMSAKEAPHFFHERERYIDYAFSKDVNYQQLKALL